MARSKSEKRTNSQFNKDISEYRKYLLNGLVDEIKGNVEEAITTTIEEVLTEAFALSQENVPYADGDLKNSGRVTEVKRNGNTWSASIVYGDGMTNYAYFVHENMAHNAGNGPSPYKVAGLAKTYSNNGSGNRGPKYLERAMDEVLGNGGEKLKNKLRDNLRKVMK